MLQHNVLNFEKGKFNFTNTCLQSNPHIVLINSQGMIKWNSTDVSGYNSHKPNMFNENNDETWILIRKGIKHEIKDYFMTNF